jgi:hypothetical protein
MHHGKAMKSPACGPTSARYLHLKKFEEAEYVCDRDGFAGTDAGVLKIEGWLFRS